MTLSQQCYIQAEVSCGVRSFVVCVDGGEGFQGGMGSEGGPRGLAPELTANEKPSDALLSPCAP